MAEQIEKPLLYRGDIQGRLEARALECCLLGEEPSFWERENDSQFTTSVTDNFGIAVMYWFRLLESWAENKINPGQNPFDFEDQSLSSPFSRFPILMGIDYTAPPLPVSDNSNIIYKKIPFSRIKVIYSSNINNLPLFSRSIKSSKYPRRGEQFGKTVETGIEELREEFEKERKIDEKYNDLFLRFCQPESGALEELKEFSRTYLQSQSRAYDDFTINRAIASFMKDMLTKLLPRPDIRSKVEEIITQTA